MSLNEIEFFTIVMETIRTSNPMVHVDSDIVLMIRYLNTICATDMSNNFNVAACWELIIF